MPSVCPKLELYIVGRNGGEFNNFGDYSVDLFNNIDYYGNPASRALFDMAEVAIIKNHNWAESQTIPCSIVINEKQVEQPKNDVQKLCRAVLIEVCDAEGVQILKGVVPKIICICNSGPYNT